MLSFLQKEKLLSALLAIAAVALLLVAYNTAIAIADYYTPLPIWDYWDVVAAIPNMQAGHWGFLWQQHNEHRIVFPQLVFSADMLWWHGRMFLPLTVTFLCYTGTWLLLSVAVFRDRAVNFFMTTCACALAGSVALWRTAALVLAEPFLLQWTLLSFAYAAALLALTGMRERENWRAFSACVMAGVVATYSSGNGLLLWPVLGVAGVLLRLRWRQWLAVLAAGGIAIGCYFIGFRSTGSLNIGNLLRHPLMTLGFVASYLSMPFGGLGSVSGRDGLIFGGFALGLLLICFVICLRRGWLREPAAVVLFSFIGLNMLTALLTAGGRLGVNDSTFGFAKALRYLSVPQINWAALVLLALWTAARLGQRRIILPVYFAVALALVNWLPKLDGWTKASATFYSENQLASVSFESGAPDERLAFAHVFPDLNLLRLYNTYLEKSGKSIYYRGRIRWLKKPVSRFAPLRSPLPGAVAAAFPVEGSIQIAGWADDAQLRKPVLWVLLADEGGAIRGFARRFPAGFPDSANTPAVPPSLGWAGYVPSDMAGRRVFAYAVDSRKLGLMPLGAAFRVPDLSLAAAGERGASLPDVTWTTTAGAGSGTARPSVPAGDFPPAPIRDTWGGSDAATGSIISSAFPRPANGCVVVPIRTGPSAGGLEARLEDADTAAPIEDLPIRSGRTAWQFWRVTVNEAHKHLRVVVNDEGRGWGQWASVSTPLGCQ